MATFGMKLKSASYKSHWNVLVFYNLWKIMPDLNMSHGKMSDFVSFLIFWVHFSHKTEKFRFWKSLKYFNIFDKEKDMAPWCSGVWWCSVVVMYGAVVLWLSLLHNFIHQNLNSGSVQVQIDGEDIFWQRSWLEIKLNAFRWSTIPQKQFIIIIIIIIIIVIIRFEYGPQKNVWFYFISIA